MELPDGIQKPVPFPGSDVGAVLTAKLAVTVQSLVTALVVKVVPDNGLPPHVPPIVAA